MKTVFISGSNGFIGKNLVEQLSDNFHILNPSSKELNLLELNKLLSYYNNNHIDAIVHAAVTGKVLKNTSDTNIIYPNLLMFYNLMRARKPHQKIIFLGSGAEYDKSRKLTKVKESDFGTRVPVDEYGLFKYICSKYIENADNIVSLRLFGVYGKYEEPSRFISETITKCLHNQPIIINQNVKFDYLYVNDLAKIVKYFLAHNSIFKFYNVASGQVRDIKSIAQKIIKITNKKLPIKILKPGRQNDYTSNISRLKSEIPNLKFTKFEETIKELVKFYKNNE